MKLGTKIVLYNLILGILGTAVLYVLVLMVWMKSFEQLEQNVIKDNIRRTQFIWNKEQDTLKSVVGDWAPWDDLFEFARNPRDTKFATNNLQDSAMANLRINAVVVTDPAGRILFAKAIDLEQKQEVLVPPELRLHIRPGQLFLDGLKGAEAANGIIWMENRPVLLSAQRILKSDKTGESPGILVFLRKVDDDLLKEFADIVQVPVHIEKGEKVMEVFNAMAGNGQELRREDRVTSFLPMKDIYGKIPFALAVETPRTLNVQANRHLREFVLFLLCIVAGIVLSSILAWKQFVLRRLERMDSFLKQVDMVEGKNKQMEVEGTDELSQVTVSMNQMLERIAASNHEIEKLNEVLLAELVERKQTEKALLYSSRHDALTGLYNRNYLDELLQRFMKNGAQGVGVICCDLDGLKLINDTLGHAAGDRMLQQTARILQENVPARAVIARTGGDEFLVVLDGIEEEELTCIGQKIQEACEQQSRLEFPLQLSRGYRYKAVCGAGTQELDLLLKGADDEMYRQKLSSNQSTRSGVVQAIMKMLEVRDFVTEDHSQRLAQMAIGLSERAGLPEHRKNDLRLLAQFHDVGKIGVPDHILLKPDALSFDERKEMKRHSEIGHRIANVITELQPIAEFILKHHEKWDGTGYPLGLAGEAIPIESRILAIVDAYDAMISDRPYRRAMSHEAAAAEIEKGRGSQFDPVLAEEFLAMMASEEQEADLLPGFE